MQAQPRITPPAASMGATASRKLPPVVITSSITTTLAPGSIRNARRSLNPPSSRSTNIDGRLDTAKAFFLQFWGEEFEDIDAPRTKDPKTQLQEWAQGLGLPLPRYEIISREGPAHAPAFVIEVEVQGFSPERGEGGSRQAAEKSAALTMLLKREGVESEPETDQ